MKRTIGRSTIVTESRIPQTMEHLIRVGTAATAIGANEVRKALISIYNNEGNGQWPPNAPSTIASKGTGKQVMEDLGQLFDGIRILPISIMSPVSLAAIGWDATDIHTSHGRISMAALATIHDGGFEELGIPARPWMSQFIHDPDAIAKVLEVMVLAIMAGKSVIAWGPTE